LGFNGVKIGNFLHYKRSAPLGDADVGRALLCRALAVIIAGVQRGCGCRDPAGPDQRSLAWGLWPDQNDISCTDRVAI